MGFTITEERTFMQDEDYRNYLIMNKSNHSYALNKKITDIFSTNSWRKHRCFLIGGGESLRGFDFSQLDGELTIGINKAFQAHPNFTINYAMDSILYDAILKGQYVEQWNAFKGIRLFLTPMEIKQFGPEVHLIRRIIDFKISHDLNTGIYGGKNSGLGAIMLAVVFGSNPIYLLGYDMKAKEHSHWHEGYPNRDITEFNVRLAEYKHEIQTILPFLNNAGFEIVNLNKDNELKCKNVDTLENVLKKA
jgi:hypothetical protein